MIPHSNHLSGLFDCIIWVQVSQGERGGGGDTVIFSFIHQGSNLAKFSTCIFSQVEFLAPC